jgi:hypothetical protein
MQASPAADHVGSMNARLVFRQEAVNDAGAAQPRMPEFDTWVLLGLTIGGVVRVEPSPVEILAHLCLRKMPFRSVLRSGVR